MWNPTPPPPPPLNILLNIVHYKNPMTYIVQGLLESEYRKTSPSPICRDCKHIELKCQIYLHPPPPILNLFTLDLTSFVVCVEGWQHILISKSFTSLPS